MCNNNGHCRKFDAGTMCPSYRATRDEEHLTRGRANTLRLALVRAAGSGCRCAGEGRARSVRLLQGLQARMPDRRRHGAHEDRIPGALPQAPRPDAARARDRLPAALRAAGGRACAALRTSATRWCSSGFAGFTDATRRCRRGATTISSTGAWPKSGEREVVLLVDTFNRYFEPENARAAIRVLQAAGYRVHAAQPREGGRPLCCGRTFLSAGLVDEATRRGASACSRRSRPGWRTAFR